MSDKDFYEPLDEDLGYDPGVLRRAQRSVNSWVPNTHLAFVIFVLVVLLVVCGLFVSGYFIFRSLPALTATPSNAGLQCGGIAGVPNVQQPELDGCGDFVAHGNCAGENVCRYAVFPARSNSLTVIEFDGLCSAPRCVVGDGSSCVCERVGRPVCTRLTQNFTFNFACRERDTCGAPSDFRAPIVEGRGCGVSLTAPGVCEDTLCVFSVYRDGALRNEAPARRACMPTAAACVDGNECECADNVCSRFAIDGTREMLTFECV